MMVKFKWLYRLLLCGAAFLCIVACDNAPGLSDDMDRNTLTVLDFNIWHGLNPKGIFRFDEYETKAERQIRLQGFIEQARNLKADIIFLQEVNPAPGLTRYLAKTLGMDSVYILDNAGLKIGAVGLPVNFRSGLAILAKKDLGLRKVGKKKLSGPFGGTSRALSFQYSEFRYALAAKVTVAGETVLLINTHLHHGNEMSPSYAKAIEKLVSEGTISQERADQVTAIAHSASHRRRGELSRAISMANKHGFQDLPTLFAGDFNASPDSPEITWLTNSLAFASVTNDEDPSTLLLTWDTKRNPYTHLLEDFQPANAFEAFALEHFKEQVIGESRRLDYIFTRNISGFLQVEGAGLFGDTPHRGRMISDHFGIYAKFRMLAGGSRKN